MSIKRFGARYGGSIKARFGKVENRQKASYECPSCKAKKVKRVSIGIWQCRKCSTKLAGRAYSVSKKIVIKEAVTPEEKETIAVEQPEAENEEAEA